MRLYLIKLRNEGPLLVSTNEWGPLKAFDDFSLPASALGGALTKALNLDVGELTVSNAFPIINGKLTVPAPPRSIKIKVGPCKGAYVPLSPRVKVSELIDEVERSLSCKAPILAFDDLPQGTPAIPVEWLGKVVKVELSNIAKFLHFTELPSPTVDLVTKTAKEFRYLVYVKEGAEWWALTLSKVKLHEMVLKVGALKNKGFGTTKVYDIIELDEDLLREPNFNLSEYPSTNGTMKVRYKKVELGTRSYFTKVKIPMKPLASWSSSRGFPPWDLRVNFFKLIKLVYELNEDGKL